MEKPICVNLPGFYQCKNKRKNKKKENLKATYKENEIINDQKFEASSKKEDTILIDQNNTLGNQLINYLCQ